MPKRISLASALITARRRRGWTIWQATQHMEGVFPNTLRTIEGKNPDRVAVGEKCKLKTVLAIVSAYWPEITLEDFAQRELQLRLVPKDAEAKRNLEHRLARTG